MKNYLIIAPFTLPWNWSADYQKQTCLYLAKNNIVIPYMASDAHFFLKSHTSSYKKSRNILFHAPKFVIPFMRFKLIEQLNHVINIQLLLWKYRRVKHKIIWIFDPDFHYLTRFDKRIVTLYDCVDYHRGKSGPGNKEVAANENSLIKKATYFTVNSQILGKIHSKIRIPDQILPQGFDIDSFSSKTRSKTIDIFSDKPLIGYIGGVNNRLDFEILEKLISSHPEWQFVFCGPLQLDNSSVLIQKRIFRLLKSQNVIHLKNMPRKKLATILSQIDVALIPYNLNQKFNLYCFPMKLFEYFYFHRPVVATCILELKRFPSLVKVGTTADEFEKHIQTFLKTPLTKDQMKKQDQLALENTWQNKIEVIYHVLAK